MRIVVWIAVALAVGGQAAAQVDPQIAHVAQGHGWSTVIRAMNVCDEKAQFWVNFYAEDEKPLGIVFKGAEPGQRHAAIASGLHPGEIQKYTMVDTGQELIQGFGEVTANDGYSNRSQCVFFEIEYWQHLSSGEKRLATIPLLLDSPLRNPRKVLLRMVQGRSRRGSVVHRGDSHDRGQGPSRGYP